MRYVLIIALLAVGLSNCSKLDEELNGQLSAGGAGGGVTAAGLLSGTYNAMRGPFQDQARMFAAAQHTTDETLGPTRAGDWDDNGVWRTLHTHQWDPIHSFLAETYRDLGRVVFSATDLLRFNPTTQQAAEGRMLRAMANFAWLDGWDQVPYRENTADPEEVPKVRKGTEALDYIISELNEILPNLPDAPANRANKDAARVLLMKCYLNKGVIANRAAPTFAAADMNQVITLANQLIASSKYSLASNYFDNFAPTNDALSSENIWTAENIGGSSSGNVRSRWRMTLHYSNKPDGWNGFATLSDFYSKFTADDKRRGVNYPGQKNFSGSPAGNNVGFMIGQQYDETGAALKDRTGQPLAFTPEVKLIEVGKNLEVTGIRVVKYPVDYSTEDPANNDYVYFRYADVLLMKAEALLRGGTDASGQTALQLINIVRARAGVADLASVSLDQLLDERGRELYWECWRRQDLIRFGKFLDAWQEKPASGPERLIFPIPARSLAANPNLTQNPGYSQ